tara:strand:+ start:1042 stop:2358 length:1317 start_codon:yes stop_codon:yes gene_type:complete
MALSLIAKLGLDGKGFQAGLAKANRDSRNFASGIKRQFVGMFGVAAIGVAIKRATDYADEINNLSRRLGVSSKALQEFNYAANLSGSDLKNVATSLQRVQEAQERLKNGNKQTEESFKRLGFSFDQALQVNPAEVFRRAGEQFANQSLSAENFGDIRTLFGAEAGPRNIRIFTEGLADMAKMAQDSGAVLSDAQIQTAADLKDTIAMLKMSFLGPFGQALAALGQVALEAKAQFSAFLVGLQMVGSKLQKEGGFKELFFPDQLGKGGVTMLPKMPDVRRQMISNFEKQGLSSDEASRRAGMEIAKRNQSAFGIAFGDSKDYREAELQLLKNRKNPNSHASLFKLGYDTTLQAERAEMEAQRLALQKTRALMTSTAGMEATGIAAGKAAKIQTDQLAKMGLFIGGRGNPVMKEAQKQTRELQQVKVEVQTLNKQIKTKL